MFVEASAIAAMLTDPAKARVLAGRLQTAANRFTAPSCLLDAASAVARETALPLGEVFEVVERFAQATALRTLSLPASLGGPAAAAMDRFALAPNQALAYAAARYYRAPLLFDDPAFARTDVTPG